MSRAILESALQFRCRTTKAFVFVANPGRSGSKTLADIFSDVPNFAAYHEPAPKMTADSERGLDQSEYLRSLFFEKKIFYVLRAAAGHSHYLETNHLFVKTFVAYAVEFFKKRLHIIHLQRDAVSVALSFFRLGQVPGNGDLARRYMLELNDPANIIDGEFLSMPDSTFSHPFYRCLWYWYEVEARIQRAKDLYPEVRWLHLRTEELNDRDAIRSLCQDLSADLHLDIILGHVGKRSNTRLREKEEVSTVYMQLGADQARDMDECLKRELRQRNKLNPLL